MDIHMPEMDGIDATIEILKLDPNIPIVAMTANIMPDDVKNYISSGMRECLSKPFASHDIWDCLLRYFKPVAWKTEDPSDTEANFRIKLFEKIESLLKEDNADCVSYIDELRDISGSDMLIGHLENFDFKLALDALLLLKEKNSENNE